MVLIAGTADAVGSSKLTGISPIPSGKLATPLHSVQYNGPIMSSTTLSAPKKPSKTFQKCLAAWGVLGVISILANAIKRLYPIAIQPFIQKDLTPLHWGI
eukprot:gene3870-5116_t